MIKEDIVANWDSDYETLGGESFNITWLDDPQKVFRLKQFLVRMWGRIADAHYLSGEEKEARVNLIQQTQKELVWASISVPPEADLGEEKTSQRLESILNNLTEIQNAK